MDKVEKELNERLFKTANAWWRSHRPVKWKLKQHMENPTVNMSRPSEDDLAHIVSAIIYYRKHKRLNPRKDGGDE